ncbi:MAG: thiol-disulfide oxidoreductase DCC family protein [Bacteroidota bacterium]
MKTEEKHPVILFDGVCNLCNRSVSFVIRNDRKGLFRFAALQSEKGRELRKQYGLDKADADSYILIENGKAYLKSTASLRTLRKLRGLYPLLYLFILVPRFIRDAVYDWVARNRYKWWGKRESCMVPSPEIQNRFI